MCATNTSSAAIDMLAPISVRRNGFTPIKLMIVFIEAFQEALEMRRAMLRNDVLNEE